MSSTLRAFLVNSSRALGVEPHHLIQPDANSDVQTALLQDVIALRDQGHADRSLALLDAAAEAGLSSDWIQDNRARALLALGRDQEALAVLEPLTACGTEAVAKAAWQQMEVLTGPAVGDSVEAAPAAAAVAGPEEAVDPTPVLKEAIQLRESGDAQASLEVLEQALAQGLSSPWIEDNRARALVMLERRAEALAIWERLAEGEDEGVRGMAAEMASRQRQALEALTDSSIDALIDESTDETTHTEEASAKGRPLTALEEDVLAESELSPELKAQLDAAIALRESGQVEASMAMLDRCSQEGQRSPWLAENRARVLLQLARRDEAETIWQALAGSTHEAVSGSAQAMLQQLENQRLQAVRDQWLQLAEAAGESLPGLESVQAGRLAELERPLLEESIRLRNSGAVGVSLELLDAAVEEGLRSPWVDDNRARALVMLERRAEALAIWERLAEGDDERVRAMAAQMAESQGQMLLEELQASLRQVGEAQGRAMPHLLEAKPSLLIDLELPVLKQAIDLRESGDWDLSLQLLEAAIAGGLTSPWINDNRARVLVNLERYSEAVELWQQLLDCDIPGLEDSAKAMLELNQDRGLEQTVLQNVDRALNEASSAEAGRAAALELLTDALLKDSECEAFQERLGQLAATQASNADPAEGSSQFPELDSHQKVLEGFDLFLSVLEKRCQPTPESSEAERV
jgi:hypothetical protein